MFNRRCTTLFDPSDKPFIRYFKKNIFIDSDDRDILAIADKNGFAPLLRKEGKATNATGGVELLKIFANQISAKTIIQAFPPMPYLDLELLSKMVSEVHSGKFNSAIIREASKMYIWKDDQPGYAFSSTGEIPNSVDLPEIYIEFPTVYVVNREHFLSHGSRLIDPIYFGQTQSFESKLDIDEEQDLRLARLLYELPHIRNSYNWKDKVAHPISRRMLLLLSSLRQSTSKSHQFNLDSLKRIKHESLSSSSQLPTIMVPIEFGEPEDFECVHHGIRFQFYRTESLETFFIEFVRNGTFNTGEVVLVTDMQEFVMEKYNFGDFLFLEQQPKSVEEVTDICNKANQT